MAKPVPPAFAALAVLVGCGSAPTPMTRTPEARPPLSSPWTEDAARGVDDPALARRVLAHWEHAMQQSPEWASQLGDHRRRPDHRRGDAADPRRPHHALDRGAEEHPVTHPNAALIDRFYAAFARTDGETMASCYAADATFCDPVFPALRGAQVGGMWRMLCAGAADLRVEHRDVVADDETGAAHWEAWYTFSVTGRKVHNVIDARFRFADGEIVNHVDTFDFGRWSRQAIGAPAVLLGWTGLVQRKIRGVAGENLTRFLADDA